MLRENLRLNEKMASFAGCMLPFKYVFGISQRKNIGDLKESHEQMSEERKKRKIPEG